MIRTWIWILPSQLTHKRKEAEIINTWLTNKNSNPMQQWKITTHGRSFLGKRRQNAMFKQKNDINWQRRMTRQKGYCTFDAVMWQHCDMVEEYIQAWPRAALKKEKKT